jgi:hypothetical protein
MRELLIDRNNSQKLIHIGKLRAELFELGYSIVTTEWLNGVFKEVTAANLERIAQEKTK